MVLTNAGRVGCAALGAGLTLALLLSTNRLRAQSELDAGGAWSMDAGAPASLGPAESALAHGSDGGFAAPDGSAPVVPLDSAYAPASDSSSSADLAAPGLGSAPAGETWLEPALEVTVVGRSKSQKIRESAQAVTVVELDRARRQAADLGEVLARVQGINVRRQGGLGSNTRFSLNGLSEDQIRFFLDDVPLELAGFSQGIANIPLLMLERVVVYRGVVPIRFGADALGGAVNLVSEAPTRGRGVGGSYMFGSFGTHRATLFGYQVHRPSGLFTRLSLYADSTRNDYWIEVEEADELGRTYATRVRRPHDAYRAFGGSAELGFVKRPWAEKLILRAFAMRLDKELQHDLTMSVPYGEARFDRANYGATLRYEQPLPRAFRIEALGGYAYQPLHFLDDSAWVYNWRGQRGNPDSNPGETFSRPIDLRLSQHAAFARSLLSWRVREGHKLELALQPNYTLRSGEDRRVIEGSRDPYANRQTLFTLVTGLSYELNVWDDRLENVVFGKSYLYRSQGDETAPNGVPVARSREIGRFGVGDALRVRITRALYTKLSYEWATRLPRPVEVFGDGLFVGPNVTLFEETSHNGNLELTLSQDTRRAGQFRGSANGFVRDTHNQIVLVPIFTSNQRPRYENIYSARSKGVETNVGWTSGGDYLALDGNVTYIDFRNGSRRGTFGMYRGDRVPNRPHLLANASTRGLLRALIWPEDELSLTWYLRYTHEFYRFWESAGRRETKYMIPAQTTHALVLTYLVALEELELSATIEGQNLSDARVFDEFGVQKPGRAFYLKLTGRR